MTGRAATPGTYRSALANRSFLLALESYALACVAQGLWTVALAVALYQQTGSAAWAAIAACTRLVPYLLVSPIAGVVTERWGYRRTLETTTVARIALAALVTVGIGVDAPPIALAAVAFLATVAATPVYPAINTFVPAAVPASDLAAANSLLSTTESLGWIIGPAIGGILAATSSPTATAAAATILVILALVVLRRLPRAPQERQVGVAWAGVLEGLLGGVRALLRTGPPLAVLLLILATNLIDGSAQVLLLLVADEQLGLGDSGYGLLTAVTGAGALAAVTVNRRMAAGRRPLLPLLAAVGVASTCYALLGVIEVPVAAMVLLALVSGACVVVEVVSITILQRSVPRRQLAAVFGLLDALVVAAIVVGAVLAPLLDELLGLTMAMVVTGAVLPGAVAVFAPFVWRAGRTAVATADEVRSVVEALAALPLLQHAPDPILEALALAGRRVVVRPGEMIVRQGEPSDDVYIVAAGSYVVLKAGRQQPARVVNRCVAGDCFGEIGPLAGVARTASVVAETDGELLRIPGAAFVDAVHGSALGAGSSAVAGIVTRVATSAGGRDQPDDAGRSPG